VKEDKEKDEKLSLKLKGDTPMELHIGDTFSDP
jgi:hypothetical protein